MSSFWWTLTAAVLVTGVSAGNTDTTAFPVIPNHLLECYIDDGIYHRANRMQNDFDSFLDLIRKVEQSPTARNMNAREFSMVLLHYLKLDGIQSLQSHTKLLPINIIPYAPSGEEYFKHRLTLVGLVPRIDPSYMSAVNETLSTKEMCNLHFMLSYSIDPYKRDNERCDSLYEESRRPFHSEPRPEWDPYQNIHNYYRQNRHRREVEELQEILQKRALENLLHGSKSMTEHEIKELEIELKEFQELSRRRRHSESNKDKKAEVEAIPPQHPAMQHSNPSGNEKDKFTIGNQELLSGGEDYRRAGMQSLVQSQRSGRYGGRPYVQYGKVGHSIDQNAFSGVIPGIPLSDCPVVNGVIKTTYGSLAIGSVIAGIAAGLNPEEIPPTRLSVDPRDLESPMDKVKNIWAATLAGTVADTISSSALLDDLNNIQILKGGWNDTSDLKWYLLKTNQYKHLAEVAIRGSLDGLLLGLSAKEWTSKFSSMKLSQMLQSYYNCYWGGMGAKNRAQLRPKYAPDETFTKQLHLMSLVFKKQKTNFMTVLDYTSIVREAVAKVTNYIQNMDDNERSSIGVHPSVKIDSAVNAIAVVDSSWGYENLLKIFEELRASEVASTPMQSNLTVICGNDGRVLMYAENKADLYNRFTKEMLYENCTRGMNLPLVIETLELAYRKILHEEQTANKMNTDAQVAILLPFEIPLQETLYTVEAQSRNFWHTFPDVRLMVASNGRSESFGSVVKNPKDLFNLMSISVDPTLKTFKEFADGVKQSYQRISRPSCGSYFDDQSQGTEVRVTKDVKLGDVAYYRLSPQYFYTVKGEATISIRSKLRAPLTVCHSREMDRPAGPTPRGGENLRYPNSDYNPNRSPNYNHDYLPNARQTEEEGPVQCKTITMETYKIQLNNPCEGASSLAECLPLYISLSPPVPETFSIMCTTCRLPTNVQYEISVAGLTCYNSAAAILASPLLFALVFILFLSDSKIF